MDYLTNDVNIVVNDSNSTNILKASFKKPFDTTNAFQVSLTSYPMQPWTNKNVDLKQWFNYGLNPSTWSKYCIDEMQKCSK